MCIRDRAGCSSCFFCDGLADTDDVEWLCLCTTEVQRAHRACCVQPRRHGRLAVERRCPACGLTNQHGRLHAARQRARVVIVGGGPAGLAAAHLLRKSGMQPQVLEARQRLGAAAEGRRPRALRARVAARQLQRSRRGAERQQQYGATHGTHVDARAELS